MSGFPFLAGGQLAQVVRRSGNKASDPMVTFFLFKKFQFQSLSHLKNK